MDWKKELEDIEVPNDEDLKKLKKEEPKHSKEYLDYFDKIIGKGFNFTRKELDDLRYSLK